MDELIYNLRALADLTAKELLENPVNFPEGVLKQADDELEKRRWIPVEERLPEEAVEYLVAYNPCCWDSVSTTVVRVGMDTFRGESVWAKEKYQRVTHWMALPSTEGLNET